MDQERVSGEGGSTDPLAADHPAQAPLFSVIVVCRNAETHLVQALDSVLDQTCDDFELVVVDGVSTDGTLDIIRDYEPRFMGRMRWNSEPDHGIYDAMNKGLERACGTYVAYLGADDLLEPDTLESVAVALRKTSAEIVAGETVVFNAETSWHERCRPHQAGTMPLRLPSRHQSLFVSKAAMDAVGGFDVRLKIAADYDLYVRLIQNGARVICIPQVLSRFRLGGVSSSNTVKTAKEYRDIRVSHGSPRFKEQLRFIKAIVGSKLFSAGVRWTR